MKTITLLLLAVTFAVFTGCSQQNDDPRIHVRDGIGSDTIGSNIVTRTVAHAFSALIGEGIEIDRAFTRINDAGFMELHVDGFNKSYNTKRFRYRVEWLDEDGAVIDTKTSVWTRTSAMGKSAFSFKAIAPRTHAVDFRLDTRKWE